MPEAATIAERPPVKEAPKASNGLMLHIAHGEFDSSKLATLDASPQTVAEKSYDVLQDRFLSKQSEQQQSYYQHIKQRLQSQGWPEDKITPELLRHSHMKDWALLEARQIGLLFYQQKDNLEGQATLVKALGKLHIVVDDNSDAQNLPDQLYKTTSDVTGTAGAFYEEFCKDGNLNKKLVETLDEADIIILRNFLVDTLGSETAYQALLATKQTQDAIVAKHDFSANSSTLAEGEQPILDFFREGTIVVQSETATQLPVVQESEDSKKREKDVFENEAATNPEAHKKLMAEMVHVLEEEKTAGKGKLQATIQETAQGPHGKEVIHDGYVVYIPAGPGERIVTIGDIHGDLATVQQILAKEQFFEDMASGSPKIQLVFQGDLVDRGPKSVEVMTAIMKLKTLYKDRVHIIAADHDTTSPNVLPHDFPDKLKNSFGSDSEEIYQLYNQVFGNMAKMVVTGNGIVVVHGGPAAEALNLAQIGRLEDTDTNGLISEQFSWSDPIAHPNQNLETAKAQTLQTYEYVANWAATQPNLTDESVIKMPGSNDVNLKLKDIKQVVEMLKNLPVGEYPNPNRAGSGLMIDALFQGLLYYDQRAFDSFMQRIGGKVMVRGHQVSDEVDGGKPNLFGDKLWTIHSTGTGSPESHYARRENHPKYASFDLGNDIDTINQANIKNVW